MKIERAKKYFDKNGYIYGDSYKYNFGRWEHRVYKFDDLEQALDWYQTEEYDFRERELISRTEAIKHCKDIDERFAAGYKWHSPRELWMGGAI